MGVSGKPQVDGGLESEGKKWVIAGISLRAPLKAIYTNPAEKDKEISDETDECSTTPTGEEARIPTILTCPPAPRKRKPSLKCNYGSVREFFTPPDLESVFIRHVERAN
ncbi:cyclin-dependent protein kinase inhibitor SMR6-like [Herrania umbratica]|uniref:Cyclin-dependent protein kinase inhibitor SMR6-like n=1 Tax=Herrania umbratica TaxID=108875 RepID=A0A6J1B1X7_9ROSI|nr:cyclin-dependent protein kinase inhibitor SMR6-like [Herrania umbratica]